jgi:transposase
VREERVLRTKKRLRRKFSAEIKAETVQLVRDSSGKPVRAIARELDLTETALRRWLQQAEVDAGRGPAGGATGCLMVLLLSF